MSQDPAVNHERPEHHHDSIDHSAHNHDHGGGAGLTRQAISATVHCLTGCAIGEVLGMVLATWWGWSNGASIVLSIVLAFVFGYSLTITPVLRAGVSPPDPTGGRDRCGRHRRSRSWSRSSKGRR